MLSPARFLLVTILLSVPAAAQAQEGELERVSAQLAEQQTRNEELVERGRQLEKLLTDALERADEAQRRAEVAETKLRAAEARIKQLEGQEPEAGGLVDGERLAKEGLLGELRAEICIRDCCSRLDFNLMM